MKLPNIPRPVSVTRRVRARLILASAVALFTVGVTAPLLTASTASATHRSPCEDGTNVGETCHYTQVVSDGPDYDVKGYLLSPRGQHLYDWKESNPDFTNWWYRYDQFSPPPDTMNLIINLRGDDNIGLTRQWSVTEDHCFLITNDRKIVERPCPV
jgi:hypothetical protein